MNAEQTRDELRIRSFDRAFPRITNREHWLTMYLALRDGGDTHSAAVETVRGEMLMLQRTTAEPAKSARRKVKIEQIGDTWFVLYVERNKHQHHSAAQFYAPDHSREQVVQWVKTQTNLELI